MKRSSFVSSGKKVYRFNVLCRWYHFIFGAVVLVTAVVKNTPLIFLIPILLLSAFIIARPFTSAAIVDPYSVTVKTIFSERLLQRSSIIATDEVTGSLLKLKSDPGDLTISDSAFAFDEAWDDWLSTYMDLSSDKPLSLFEN